MKKKIVSLLLTAALALSLLPMGALAASNTVFLDGYASDDAVIESSAAPARCLSASTAARAAAKSTLPTWMKTPTMPLQ